MGTSNKANASQNVSFLKVLAFTYILVVALFSLTTKAAQLTWIPSDKTKIQSSILVGEIAMDIDDRVFILTNDHRVYELVSEHLDLRAFNGLLVAIKVIDLHYSTGPIYETMSQVPFIEQSHIPQVEFPVLEVISIQILE